MEAELSAQLVGLARLSEGFTQSRVQASSFNLAAFQKAAADPKSSAYETLGALLSPGKNHKDPLRLEFAAAKDQDLEAYEQRLSEALTQSCDFEAFKPACVRSGLAHLEEKVAKIKIAYGPNEEQVFDGYYLFVSKNTEDKDSAP